MTLRKCARELREKIIAECKLASATAKDMALKFGVQYATVYRHAQALVADGVLARAARSSPHPTGGMQYLYRLVAEASEPESDGWLRHPSFRALEAHWPSISVPMASQPRRVLLLNLDQPI